MREFYRYLRGYVKVPLTGLSPERFFNLCSSAGLELWNVVSDKPGVSFCMDLSSFFRCRPYVRKSGVKLRVTGKQGFPFFLHRNRRRGLWAAGFSFFFFLLFGLSFFIWDIEYQGNTAYTDSQLGHTLDRLGVRCGILKTSVSCDELEEALREEYDGITWVSARVNGTRLYVHIKENEVPMEILKEDETPCDLVADADAVIQSIIVRSGIPMVKAGDAVTKGQVLVSGRIPITDDGGTEINAHYVHADADVIGLRERIETKAISCWHQTEVPTGNTRSGLALKAGPVSFVWLFPNFRNTTWNTVTRYEQAELFGDFVLPLHLGLISSEEVSVSEDFYTEEELSLLASGYETEVMENLMEKGVHIIENNVKILVNGSVCRFTVTLKTEESIKSMSQQGEEQFNEHN